MKTRKKPRIDWRRGAGSMMLSVAFMLAMIALLVLYLTVFNCTYAATLVSTRTDAIADSVAVYSQSFDYRYNESQGELMRSLLTQYNNSSDFYDLTTSVDFGEANITTPGGNRIRQTLTVNGSATVPALYPDLMGTDSLTATASVEVDSVDIFGDTIVVPPEPEAHETPAPSATPGTDTEVIAPTA